MANDATIPNGEITRRKYLAGMKDLGRGLIALAVLQVILLIFILLSKFDQTLVTILAFLAVFHVGTGIAALQQRRWVNWVVAVYAILLIGMNLFSMAALSSRPGYTPNPAQFVVVLVLAWLLYRAMQNHSISSKLIAADLPLK